MFVGVLGILLSLIVTAIIIYAVYLVLNMLPIPQPIKTLIWLVLAIIFLVMILNNTGLYHTNY